MPVMELHRSPYSGSWYPGERAALEDLLEELFERSAGRTGAHPLEGGAAFVVPHAGLVYSGVVAAAAYRHISRSRPPQVIVLGFAHRGAPAGLWLPEVEAYRTPLGDLPVDRELARELLQTSGFRAMREEALCDHSVEIQFPLLQKAVPDARVLPIYVSSVSTAERHAAAAELAGRLGPGTVIVASSDFTHYGSSFGYKPFPCDAAIAARLEALDGGFIEAAGSLDPDLFLDSLDAEAATVCGRDPVSFLLQVLKASSGGEDLFQQTLDYQTSGEITGDYRHSVSYAALGYFPWRSFHLGEEDKRRLLASAYETLHHYQRTGKAAPVPLSAPTPALQRPAAAFVTLRQHGRLRGCVGRCRAVEPLASVVPEMTIAAAVEDSRFDPLKPSDRDIEIEISVLSPMKRLADPAGFQVGRDGGHLSAGGHSGLLLPHVAEGRRWTRQDFLGALAKKAGLSPNVYSESGAKLSIFRAQVIR
ncbi:MAG: AmmeMemoRadiSam system protein B [Bryobacteraceae bacterium]|nr:AmmeMemoRadiSam system protein B [Bryobacteraceae bacterium]